MYVDKVKKAFIEGIFHNTLHIYVAYYFKKYLNE